MRARKYRFCAAEYSHLSEGANNMPKVRDRYLKIAPFVTALPVGNGGPTMINVCTAKGEVLDAFKPGGETEWSGMNADQLAKTRQSTTGCFPTAAFYQKSLGTQQGTGPTVTRFAENSKYFRLTSLITIGGAEFSLYSLMYIDGTGVVRPIQRSFTPD